MLGPKMLAYDTHTQTVATVGGYKLAPDGQFRRTEAESDHPNLGNKTTRDRLSRADLLTEFKTEETSDPFRNATDGTLELSDTVEGQAVLGQLIDYGELMFRGTFRTHAFMLLFCGTSIDFGVFRASAHSSSQASMRASCVGITLPSSSLRSSTT
jgi:hypothetical protein